MEEFFHRSVSNGTGEGGNFEEKHRKIICFFEKKTFQLLICFLQVRVYVSSFLVILILSFLDDVSSLFSNVTIHSLNAKDKIPQPLYLEIHLKWNSLFSLGSFLTVKQFLLQTFLFLTFTLFIVYKKLVCHKYIHTTYYITSEHLSEYIKNTHGYRYHAKVQQNTCFSQLENIFKILCPRNTIV